MEGINWIRWKEWNLEHFHKFIFNLLSKRNYLRYLNNSFRFHDFLWILNDFWTKKILKNFYHIKFFKNIFLWKATRNWQKIMKFEGIIQISPIVFLWEQIENTVVEVFQIPYLLPDLVDSFHGRPWGRYKWTSFKTFCYQALC